jgi:hypothetical protein
VSVEARVSLVSLLLVCAASAGACTSSDGSTSSSGASGSSGATSACAADTRKDVYAPGLTKATTLGAFTLKIVDATPAPPAKLNNAMTFQLLDAAGKPVDGAALGVVPFMPDHGHGSALKPAVTGKGGGLYDVANLYYPMPGLWRVTITVQAPPAAPQDAVFSFCIDG